MGLVEIVPRTSCVEPRTRYHSMREMIVADGKKAASKKPAAKAAPAKKAAPKAKAKPKK